MPRLPFLALLGATVCATSGCLMLGSFVSGLGPGGWAIIVDQNDCDRNGTLNQVEASRIAGSRRSTGGPDTDFRFSAENFAKYDANRDGGLDAGELYTIQDKERIVAFTNPGSAPCYMAGDSSSPSPSPSAPPKPLAKP